jgi:hypothetical protein
MGYIGYMSYMGYMASESLRGPRRLRWIVVQRGVAARQGRWVIQPSVDTHLPHPLAGPLVQKQGHPEATPRPPSSHLVANR